MTEWFDIVPLFDVRQFERTFQLKKFMVEEMIAKVIEHNNFWARHHDFC